MSLFGSSYKEESTPEEKYREITGNQFDGDEKDLLKAIKRGIESNHTSRTEAGRLMDLKQEIEKIN